MTTHRVAVFLTDEEYGRVRSAAGLAKMSAWIRHVVLAELDGERGTREPRGGKDGVAEVQALAGEAGRGDVAVRAVQTADGAAPKNRRKTAAKAAEGKVSGLCKHGALPRLCKHAECRGY